MKNLIPHLACFLAAGLIFTACKADLEEKEDNAKKPENKSYNIIKEKAQKFENTEASHLNEKALAFVQAGDYKTAKHYFMKSLEIEPNSSVVYNNLGLIAVNENQVQQASDYFQQSIKLDSAYFNPYVNYSSLLLENDYLDKAIHYNSFVIKQCSDKQLKALAHFINSYAYLMKQECEEALVQYRLAKVLENDPNYKTQLNDLWLKLQKCIPNTLNSN
ncbi:MAG: tetratricopeptide repeat protein [Bacteroidota bacterium]